MWKQNELSKVSDNSKEIFSNEKPEKHQIMCDTCNYKPIPFYSGTVVL